MWPTYCGDFKIYVDFCFNSDFTTRGTTSRQVDLLAFSPRLNTSEYIGSCQRLYKLLSDTRSSFFLHTKEPWISVKSKPWWYNFWYQSWEQNQRADTVPHLPWTPGDFFSFHSAAYVLNRSSCALDPSNSSQGISPASGLGLGPLADRSVQQLVPHYCHHSIHKLSGWKWQKHTISVPAPMQNM